MVGHGGVSILRTGLGSGYGLKEVGLVSELINFLIPSGIGCKVKGK